MEYGNAFVKKTDPKMSFELDHRNAKVILNLWNYFLKKPGELDLNKGIWLMGTPGTGKSALINIFSQFLRAEFRRGFSIHSANDIAIHFEQFGELDLYTTNNSGYLQSPIEFAIDEIGHEPIPSVHFGTKRNVIQYILHTRYSYWQQTGLRTFATTNLDMNEVEQLYGEAIRDRIPHMFNVIPMDGKSRRKK